MMRICWPRVLFCVALLSVAFVPVQAFATLEENGIEMDTVIKQDSGFDFVYIAGEVDGSYPNANVYELSAGVLMASDFEVNGLRMNVDGERGLVFDFDNTDAASGASANLVVQDVTMQRSDKVGTVATPVSLGTLDMQINLSNNSYLQVQGH